MPYGRFTYRVERTRIVPPTATEVTDRVGYDRLVLSACHPLYSAAQRIIVFATARARRGARPGGGLMSVPRTLTAASRTQTGCTPHHPSGER